MNRLIDAAVFDLGGVLLPGGSPDEAAARVPHLPASEAKALIFGDYGADTDHPWHRMERGEITLEECWELNPHGLRALGFDLSGDAPARRAAPRPGWSPNAEMVETVRQLRSAGIPTAALTNNVREFRPMWWPLLPYDELFDVIVDSSEVGMRKPNPAIYELTAARLGNPVPTRIAFLDDIESNLVPCRELGWHGLHVVGDGTEAIADLRRLAALSG